MTKKVSRINVVGTSGSGKSSFARALALRLSIPYIELDHLFWRPNWQMPPDPDFFPKVAEALAGNEWVLDGNYTRTIPIKWERVQMVIWLDYPFPTTLFRAVKRALNRAWTKVELWEGTGNRESFRASFFSKDSIIWWTIKTHRSVRQRYEQVLADPKYSSIEFVRLRNQKECDELLARFVADRA